MAQSPAQLSNKALRTHDATLSPPPKPGRPRLDGPQALIYNFYEGLKLLEILQRRLGLIKEPSTSTLSTNTQFLPWKVFVDQLALLNDYDSGGNTANSIAVQATREGPKYWVAMNYDPRRRSLFHLGEVLAQLATADVSSVTGCRASHDKILKISLSFSNKKFQSYRTELSKAIHYARKTLPEDNSPEAQLLSDVGPALKLPEPPELCTFAFTYAKSRIFNEILLKHRDKAPNESGSAWYNICHCIGRFQAWVRAIKILICFVKEHPEAIKGYQTGFVKYPEHLEPLEPPDADHKTNLYGVLERMLPNEPERAEKALKLLQDHPKPISQDIDSSFTELYGDKPFKPRCHAELMVLEHFWNKKLPFFWNVLYVGSSKPSCYCCDLYFRFHPSTITTRSTHCNVWPKWCLPPGLKQEDGKRLQWDYKVMLKRMTEQIRSDVLTLIESDLPRRKRVQDSTTGIWTGPTFAMSHV